jgi:hypothetical protein
MLRTWRNWTPRLVLLAVSLLYLMIGTKFVLSPEPSAAVSGLAVAAPVGRTTLRAAMGGFPLGIALSLMFCALSAARTVAGLRLAAAVTATVLAIRLVGAATDHTLSESARLLAPETVVVVLTVTMAWLFRSPSAPWSERHEALGVSAE